MTLHDWSEIATIIQGFVSVPAAFVAGIAAIFIYFQIKSAHNDNLQQIEAQRNENRKWKTLEICAQYEFRETISAAAAKVKTAFEEEQLMNQKCAEIYCDAKLILNYLDGIAIGVRQGLYIESLARDHLKQIVRFYADKVLCDCGRFGIDAHDFQFFIAMNAKWAEDEPYYRDEKNCGS
jgi:hypothetical protein